MEKAKHSSRNVEFNISLDEDNIVMKFKNPNEYPVELPNPACWISTHSSLISESTNHQIPSIRVKPNLDCVKKLVYIEKKDSINTIFPYEFSRMYSNLEKDTYFFTMTYKIEGFSIQSNTIEIIVE